MPVPETKVERITQLEKRLGRHIVHDPQSRAFAMRTAIDRSAWRDKAVRLYDPIPNPNQIIGNCTGCAKAMEFNAVGNRVTGMVLRMPHADDLYSYATGIDIWPGSYPPTDTGSSGLAAAKAAQHFGVGGEYRWLFGGADEIVQNIMEGRVVNIGTYWYWDMFSPDANGFVKPTGGTAGGHQWIARGYWKSKDWVMGRCWWGDFRDFWIARTDLDLLMAQDGDAHVQKRGSAGVTL